MVFVKPKHVGAFIVTFTVNFNISKQFKCALFAQIKDLKFITFMQNTKIEDKSLKRCDAAYSGRYGPTFQKKS